MIFSRIMILVCLFAVSGCHQVDYTGVNQDNCQTCSDDDAKPQTMAYYFAEGDGCHASDMARERISAGFALWQDFGIELVETDAESQDLYSVRVCVTDVALYAGYATWSEVRANIDIDTLYAPEGPVETGRATHPEQEMITIAAHEMGHVATRTNAHLKGDHHGIMSVTMQHPVPAEPTWTQDDKEFLLDLL